MWSSIMPQVARRLFEEGPARFAEKIEALTK
jgi:hypothetical protein